MLTDIEIARSVTPRLITDVAADLGIDSDNLELYGKYKAKISEDYINNVSNKKDGKLVLVTAINPTPAGEGKTTTTVGLGQAMKKIGKSAVIALREPSLGPVFGIKGGAAGGGWAQTIPMEDINLHFTGDMHAITSANNLLCALLDNHIHQGNTLGIDTGRIVIKRCLDMNDRALRETVIALGGRTNGTVRQDGFVITVASEIMAILCLCKDLDDLKQRLGNILVAYKADGTPVFAKDLNAQGSLATLLRDAIKPNLVQTLEGTPVFMHGGPFANIAHGCNSIRATKLALKCADYCITEAGFGSDLGAEKFLDIKCRIAGLSPSAIVIVATARALKYNGGIKKEDTSKENIDALKAGLINLSAHIENMKKYGVPVVVAINRFGTDTDAELDLIAQHCRRLGADFALSDVFAKGGDGGIELANAVVKACEKPSEFKFIYDEKLSIKEKIEAIAKNIYGADGVDYLPAANKNIALIEEMAKNMPVCIAKTQYSLSDNAALLGRPKNFRITIKDVNLSNGAGFVVALAGNIMTMPGLPKVPAANNIDVSLDGTITGLF